MTRARGISSSAHLNVESKSKNHTSTNETGVKKVDSGRTKRSTADLSITKNSHSKGKRKHSKKKLPVAQDFEVLADKANEALNLENLTFKNEMGKGIPNIKK